MTTYSFSPTEEQILQEYAKVCKMDCHPLLMAKRMLANFDPDTIIMIYPELLLEQMEGSGIVPETKSRHTLKHRMQYIRSFQTFLQRAYDSGQHLDTWFEPEYMEKRI